MSEATQAQGSVLPERIQSALEGTSYVADSDLDGMPTIEVERAATHDVLERLRDQSGFAMLTLVTAVDRYPNTPRFEVVHQLLSLEHKDRIRVRTRLTDGDTHMSTCLDLFPGAGFMERECYDMFGITFDGHEGLKRLLMPDGYGHHPLRKEFPHHGIQPDRLYREWDRERRANWKPEEA